MDRYAPDGRYAWFRLFLTLLAAAIVNAGMWMVVTILPAVEAEFQTSRAMSSLPFTLTMVGFAFGNFYLGRAVDRFGVTLSLIMATLTVVAGMGVSALSTSVVMLALGHLAIGLGSAVGFGPLIADISHWFVRRRGIAVALVASGNYLSGAIWPMALAGVIEDSGWRAAYGVLMVITLVGVIPLALALRRQVAQSVHDAAEATSALRAKTVGLSPRALQYLLCLAGIGCCIAMSMPQVHIVALCVDYGFGAAVGAEMLSLMLVGGIVSRIISGLVADRLGGVWTLLIGSTLQTIGLFLYLPAGGMVSLYVVSLVFGLSQGGIVPSYALIVREYMPAREAGGRVGFVLMATIFGMAIGGWLSGQIYDWSGSYQLAFINGIAWNLLNMAIVAWLLMRSRPRAPRTVKPVPA